MTDYDIIRLKGVFEMKKEWILKQTTEHCGKSLVETLLNSRGITKEEDVKDFLNPLEMKLTSPQAFTDMPKVVERLSKAIDNNEQIVIYGDFDADGVTSTSVLYKTFKYLGAKVDYRIPNRETQGHGLNTTLLINIMTTLKPKVLITVDCGISDVEQVKFVNSFKQMDIIITDHHEAPEILPKAYAIINPKAPNALSDTLTTKQIEYLTYLAGCGVAFKVAQGLLNHYQKTAFINEILPFVAVGTIADIVPLLGENRKLITKGLDLISQGKHEGLKLLLESAHYDITKGVTSENIAFGIAPRINASGRLDTVESAIKILVSDNVSEIKVAIENLNELNSVRQRLCDETFKQADEMYKKEGGKNPAIILYDENWHVGIIGIVASKFVEKYYKPAFLMTKKDGIFKCSARSIKGVHLYDIMSENSELFEGFGGHELAGGFSFDSSKYSFETVKKALNESVSAYVSGQDLKPFIDIDLKLNAQDITLDLVEHLSELEPFGQGNPSPIFETDNFTVLDKKLMGCGNKHLKLTVAKDGYSFPAIWWSKGDVSLNKGDKLDLAFHPQKNEFNGSVSVQLIADDIHSDKLKDEDAVGTARYKIYDYRQKTGFLNNVNDYLKNTKLKIKVFAECKSVVDSLLPYNAISSRIFTRNNVEKCDYVMFFDYPADRKTFDMILNTAEPVGLHFMNFEPKIYDETSLLKTFAGMIKFAQHNNNGKIEFIRCASFLGKSVEVVKNLLELFNKYGLLDITDRRDNFYIFKNFENTDISSLLHSQEYEDVYAMASDCDMFRKSLLEDDLEQVVYGNV